MASVASQLIEEVTAHAQSDNLEDAREICADGTYFPNNLRIYQQQFRIVSTREISCLEMGEKRKIYIRLHIQ